MTTPTETWVPELTFGARLALVRQRMGWNIKEAAKECGVPAQSWRGWEVNGRAPHNLVTIAMAIAGRTGVDVDWLIRGNRDGANPNARYPVDLTDLVNPETPAALRPRVVASVTHGDGRRSPRRPVGRSGIGRPQGRPQPTRQSHRPVSRAALA